MKIFKYTSFPTRLYVLAFLASSFLYSCKAKIDVPNPSKGSADFTKYVAIGNSLTAGYADGGLYLEGQQNSYPSMIARQLQQVGSGKFTQPLFTAAQANGSGYLQLTGFTPTGLPIIVKDTTSLAYTGSLLADGKTPKLTKFSDSINNYGVPGIKVIQITAPQLAFANPYFERILTDAEVGSVSYTQKVLASKPTFFTCWLGSNDALLYAVAGGADPNNPLTPTTSFDGLYKQFIGQLIATGAKGVLATIPDVTLTPYFTTVTVPALKAAILKATKGTDSTLYITTGSGTVRPATAADLIVLNADQIGTPDKNGYPRGIDPRNAVPNSQVLDAAEVSLTRTAIAAYNTTITSTVASSSGKLALLDVNRVLGQIAQGNYQVDGAKLSLAFISGGVFSLDGIHLTPRGYAVIANEYIKVINTTFSASVPTFSPAQYRTVKFP